MTLVSVLIPSFQHAKYLPQAIESALNQHGTEIEILIQDDCSTDRSYEIAQSYQHQYANVSVFKSPENLGGAAVHIALARRAKGEFLAVLSSDDIWQPHKTKRQLEVFQKHPQAVAVVGLPRFINSSGAPLDLALEDTEFAHDTQGPADVIRSLFDFGNMLCHPASLVRRESFLKIPNLDFSGLLASLPDLFFWISLGAMGDIILDDDIVTDFRLHDDFQNTSAMTLAHKIRHQNEHPYVLRAFYSYSPAKLAQIFPDHVEPNLSHDSSLVRLAQYAMNLRNEIHIAFAINTFVEVLADPEAAKRVKNEIDFGYSDFHKITKWCDSMGVARDFFKRNTRGS
jgi:glycosyltransferase involved in cell wall biosynthesis